MTEAADHDVNPAQLVTDLQPGDEVVHQALGRHLTALLQVKLKVGVKLKHGKEVSLVLERSVGELYGEGEAGEGDVLQLLPVRGVNTVQVGAEHVSGHFL